MHPRSIPARLYFIPWLIAAPTLASVLFSCQGLKTGKADDRRSHGDPQAKVLVTAALTGVDPADQARDRVQYLLVCQGKDAVAGTVANADGHETAQFSAPSVADGDSCALEVRAADTGDNEWLSDPQTPGLYYASSQGKVTGRRLDVTLYRVFRPKNPPEQNLVVDLTEGGTCERYVTADRTCPSTGAAAPQGACVFADARLASLSCTENQTEEACSQAFKAGRDTDGRLYAHLLFEGQSCAAFAAGKGLPGRAAKLSGLSLETLATGELSIKSVVAGGAAEAAGLAAGDVVLVVEGQTLKTPDDFFTLFESALSDTTKKDVWLSSLRGTEGDMVYLSLPNL